MYSYSISPIQQIKVLRISRNKDDFEVSLLHIQEKKIICRENTYEATV